MARVLRLVVRCWVDTAAAAADTVAAVAVVAVAGQGRAPEHSATFQESLPVSADAAQ